MNIISLIKRQTYIVVTVLFIVTTLKAVAYERISPKYETRAVWLTTLNKLDWPKTNATSEVARERQQKELCVILDKLKQAGINTIMLQTRVRATTIYPSAYEPWDNCLTGTTGKDPGYDPMSFAIEECHKRGMELHAWIVTIPVGKWNSEGCKRLRKKMPSVIKKIGDEGFMNPERKETGDYIAKICEEVVKNYDIDGIHLDYIRYPENWKMTVAKNRGREYITNIVKRINLAVKSNKKWVKLTCSPIGKYDNLTRFSSKGWNAKTRVCQDAQEWLRNGLMDGLYPMMYFKGNDFYPFAIDWKEQSCGKTIVAGLGIYFMRDKDWPLDEIKRQMEVCREYGVGHAYFRTKFFTDNTKGIYDFASEEFDKHPALTEPLIWISNEKPGKPTSIRVERFATADHLAWGDGKDNSDGNYLQYNVYASNTYPVDITDARNILMCKLKTNEISIKHNNLYGIPQNYAVTALDRYGNESEAIYTQRAAEGLFDCSMGYMLRMPKLPNNIDAKYLVIENVKKEIVNVCPYESDIDINTIRDGVYTLRTMGKKAVTHRIGWLKVYTNNNMEKRYTLITTWKK